MEHISDDVFVNILSYIQSDETYDTLISMGGNLARVVNNAVESNYFWKQKVESLIGFYLPESDVDNWRVVYDNLHTTGDILTLAAEIGYTYIVSTMLNDMNLTSESSKRLLYTSLERAAKRGQVETTRLLLSYHRGPVRSALLYNTTFNSSKVHANSDYASVVSILLNDPRVNPNAEAGIALKKAIVAGNDDVVGVLLGDPRVDPTVSNNNPVMLASFYGRTNILKMLLKDRRVDPTDNDNAAIIVALRPTTITRYIPLRNDYGDIPADIKPRLGVVQALLQDPRIDLYFDDGYIIRTAFDIKSINVIQMILEHPAFDPTANDSAFLMGAIRSGFTDIVRDLLDDIRVDPSTNDNRAIRTAVLHSRRDIVKLLLADPRVDSTADDNHAIKMAFESENIEIISLLLSDSRVFKAVNDLIQK